MIKIPTIFHRDPAKKFQVVPRLTPGCEWVLGWEGFVTIKIDGMCIKYDEGKIAKRLRPADGTHDAIFVPVVEGDPEWPYLSEAVENATKDNGGFKPRNGLYEAYGPSIAGNHHHADHHGMIRICPCDNRLMVNGYAAGIKRGTGVTVIELFDSLKSTLADSPDIEGLVFQHEVAGKLQNAAKIKRKDFGLVWPVQPTVEPVQEGVIVL